MTRFRYEIDLPVAIECDVLVVGGGSAGSAAAIAAAGTGADVLLIEKYGFLGGTGVMVLDTFYGFFTPGSVERKVIGGIPDLVIEGLDRHGMLIKRPNTYGAGAGYTYDPEVLKVVWDDLVAASGARVLLHTGFVDVSMDGPTIRTVVVSGPKGPYAIRARSVIDASGDAHVAFRAGAPFEDAGALGIAQSLTTTFKMINVDVARVTAFPKEEMWARMKDADGRYRLPRKEGSAHITPLDGVMVTNMTRVAGVDGTNVEALTEAEREGRAQALEYARFLKDEIPGYENAVLGGLSIQIGVRETRRIKGHYWLTREDVLSARKFPDAIAKCGAPIEVHHAGGGTRWEYLPDGETFDVPYRALVPTGVDNLLIAGRCLSASHDAHASVRSIGQCLAMGQAAGTAAALSVDRGVAPIAVPVETLRAELIKAGALL